MIIANETQLLSSQSQQNIEFQVQNTVNNQIHIYRQLRANDSQIQNNSFHYDDLDPQIRRKCLNLRNKIHFENQKDELEFEDIIKQWNQSLQQNTRLNQMVTEQLNQQYQNNQYQTDFPVSKIHILDYEENQPITSFSLFTSKDLIIENLILQDIPLEKSTQTDYPNQKDDKFTQTDLIDIDKDDTENVVEFFNSSFYKDLKNKQFLIDAQLISLIQTMFLMHNERKIQINEPIKQQLDLLMKKIQKKDQINYNTIVIIKDSVDI
ncbi:unnamed protein product [Paramecium primaurelia]|uniref:Uncharacterized protein n=1 Tax=Paramecium primaurelia TaxID=5886 RepID=A0A8S1L5R7_PARPR|nr:unnamed protein product [Paramecium primaurelia]